MWIRRIRWNRWPTSGENGTSESGASVETGESGHSGQINENESHLGNDVVQLWFCEVLVHLLQDLTEPQHRNEPLSFTIKEPKNELFDAFWGSLSITWRPVSVHHMWGLRACPLQEGTSASSPLWHLLLPSLPLVPYKAPYLAPQWGTPLSFLAKAPCKHLLYAKEFIFCSKAVLTQHSNIEVCMLVLLLDSLGLTRVKQPAILVL